MILNLFGERRKNQDGESEEKGEIEEPNLYELIEELLIEKQELQGIIEQMGKKIEQLQKKAAVLKEGKKQ